MALGATVEESDNHIRVKADKLHGATLDMHDCPDIAPILALTAQGKQFYDRFIAIVHEVNDRLEKGFSPEEIRLLTSLLLRVAKNLSEEDEVC